MATNEFQQIVKDVIADAVVAVDYEVSFPRTPDKRNLGVLKLPVRKDREDEIAYWFEDLSQVLPARMEYVAPPVESRHVHSIIFHITEL